MAPTSYTIQSRPPVRAFAIAAAAALLGAFMIVFAGSKDWALVLPLFLGVLGVILLLAGVALAGLAYWTMRATSVTLTLDDDGYRLTGRGSDHSGSWLEVNQVTQSESGLHITIYHGPERRTHVVFSQTDQIDAVVDDLRTRLKASRRRVEG